jgi:uncharacterized repeat protein (TIGR01451 family)
VKDAWEVRDKQNIKVRLGVLFTCLAAAATASLVVSCAGQPVTGPAPGQDYAVETYTTGDFLGGCVAANDSGHFLVTSSSSWLSNVDWQAQGTDKVYWGDSLSFMGYAQSYPGKIHITIHIPDVGMKHPVQVTGKFIGVATVAIRVKDSGIYFQNEQRSVESEPISFTLMPSGTNSAESWGRSISGRVVDENNNPIVGAYVTASTLDTHRAAGFAVTDATGDYHIEWLGAGAYQISASFAGTVTEYWPNTSSYSAASPVSITAKNDKNGIDFTLRKGGTISGTVTDSSGLPLEGIRVASLPSAGGMVFGATTNKSGSFSIGGLPLGSYKVSAGPDPTDPGSSNSNYSTKFFDNELLGSTADLVTLSPSDLNVRLVNFVLEFGGSISGQVVDQNGKPITGAYIWASPFATNNTEGNGSYTDYSGSYFVRGLPPGIYRVSAAFSGKATQYWQSAVFSAAKPISVRALSDVPGVDFVLASGAPDTTNNTGKSSSSANGRILSITTNRSSYYPSDTVTVTFRARNSGTAAANWRAVVDILPPDGSAFVYNSSQQLSLGTESSGSVQFTWTVPQSPASGKYIVQASLRSWDDSNTIFDYTWDGTSPGTTFMIAPR